MPIGRIGQEFIVNSTTMNSQIGPSITALADGRFVMTWYSTDTGDGSSTCIRGRLYNADGSAAGNDFIVNSTTTDSQADPSITALADGRFVVTWESGDTGDGSGSCIRARLYNADGTAAGDDFIVNSTTTDSQIDPSITALADGRFVVTWQSNDPGDGSVSCIRARIYNAGGSEAGGDFIVNSTPAGFQFVPSITALADGRFAVTWYSFDSGDGSGSCIRARIYNADGSAAGNDFIVNSTTTDSQIDPSITALADGRFAVTWKSFDTGDGSGSCIRARIYNADGTAAGGDFIVNSTTTDSQADPSITALADGRFVVTWESDDTGDGSGSCIRARLYNADGTAAGNDFIANSTTTNSQIDPSITALADGRFVVTWQSNDPGDGSGTCLRSQIFDPTVFIGTLGEDTWKGGNFADTINGGASADTLSGLAGDDLISGDAGNDILAGGVGNDKLFGGEGNDALNGGAGADAMLGGAGNDVYAVDSIGDRVDENGSNGTDTIQSAISLSLSNATIVKGAVENLRLLGSANINGVGNALNNVLTGNIGANVLNGGAGADTMRGLAGNDVYAVDNAGDRVDESVDGSNGTDTIRSAISLSLSNATIVKGAVENLALLGSANINGVGNALNNVLSGNSGANVLNGGTGADHMRGLGGNDVYVVDNANDIVNESLAGSYGTDAVQSSISFNLANAARVLGAVERLTLLGTGNLNGTGNALNNTIIGNAGANVLNGAAGNDLLAGGAGKDTLTGGAGNDQFFFNTALGAANIDTITDFSVPADTIRLENAIFAALTTTGTLAAAAFHVGAAAHDADDRIVYNSATGALLYDSNGSAAGGAVQFAKLGIGLALTNADFVVI